MLATSLRSNTKMGRILHQSATNSQIWSVTQHEQNKCSVDSSSSLHSLHRSFGTYTFLLARADIVGILSWMILQIKKLTLIGVQLFHSNSSPRVSFA
ncbi:hypothetical protein HanIR_Chr17g0877681 [Helianthus annuus]|nr:hypothetical protein HanIR_Chr17g0877681 [Helianthus annuus]